MQLRNDLDLVVKSTGSTNELSTRRTPVFGIHYVARLAERWVINLNLSQCVKTLLESVTVVR